MLLSTFVHLKGIGPKTEQSLWQQGITTWDKYPANGQYSLLDNLPFRTPLSPSLEAYRKGDMAFFAEQLPSAALYRVALTFPEETIFLDIETTGLSDYYDIVTLVGWSIGDSYGVYINGQTDKELRKALDNAKAIVTFNGTMFDLKFLEKHFEKLNIPPVHIDLRFLAKRVGLSGGQKKIEKIVKYKRTKDVADMLGEAAPILWHRYRRGETDALKRLIAYNHEDVEGMKRILDYCVEKLFKLESVPKKIQSSYRFAEHKSQLFCADNSSFISIPIPEFSGSSKPLIEYCELRSIYNGIDRLNVIGIDLVSSEERESGCCRLIGNYAETCRLKSDDEIITWIFTKRPDLVSIDSPLSIPEGRTSFFDDDPYRDYGIMRQCERTLKRRGINVYPCLINSMQKLTRRGMTLAEKLRQLGIPVIESYPGAAQDIMSIPRKQAGLDYLVKGLDEFGIQGKFTSSIISHDELDAITSAIVGLFFWAGMFEPLGTPQEEYLIIPDLNGDYGTWLARDVIGLANCPIIDEEFEKLLGSYGYKVFTFYEFDQIKNNQVELRNRAQSLANEIGVPIDLARKWLGKKIVEGYPKEENLIIKGILSPGDQTLMIESFGPAFRFSKAKSRRELIAEVNISSG